MNYKDFNHDIYTGDFDLNEVSLSEKIPFAESQKFMLIKAFSQSLFDELEEYPEYQNIVANLVLEIKNMGEWLQDAETLLEKIKDESVVPETAAYGYFEAKTPKTENEEPKKSFLEL